jgi:hypothetical protein
VKKQTQRGTGESNMGEQSEAREIANPTSEGDLPKEGSIITFCVTKGVTISIRVKEGGSVDSMHFW